MTSQRPEPAPLSGGGAVVAHLAERISSRSVSLAQQAHSILGPITTDRDRIRDALLAHDLIHPLPTQPVDPVNVAVVDGASITESVYAAQLIAVVATHADGLQNPDPVPPGPLSDVTVQPWRVGNGRLASGLMFMFELMLAASLPHDIRFMDGATMTALIGIATALSGKDEAADVFAEYAQGCNLTDYAADWATPLTGTIAALPKSDTATDYAETAARFTPGQTRFHVTDRVFAQQILRPGERFTSIPVKERGWVADTMLKPRHGASAATRAVCADLGEAITPYLDNIAAGQIRATYVKPTGSDTAVKVEFHGQDDTAAWLASVLAPESVPGITEPWPQYVVDQDAKRISSMGATFKNAVLTNLPPDAVDYADLLVRGHRT